MVEDPFPLHHLEFKSQLPTQLGPLAPSSSESLSFRHLLMTMSCPY